nr:hypothetical protein CFP56_07396 [Quercus suber]
MSLCWNICEANVLLRSRTPESCEAYGLKSQLLQHIGHINTERSTSVSNPKLNRLQQFYMPHKVATNIMCKTVRLYNACGHLKMADSYDVRCRQSIISSSGWCPMADWSNEKLSDKQTLCRSCWDNDTKERARHAKAIGQGAIAADMPYESRWPLALYLDECMHDSDGCRCPVLTESQRPQGL